MKKQIDAIEEQYINHPYPDPIENMDEQINNYNYAQMSGMDLLWRKLFPEKEYDEKLDVLIAGCGTNQAVYHAIKFPESKNYAIDVSQSSIDHVHKMIKKFSIKNLEVEKKDIIELDNKNEFDYVISTGVIHHTKDPLKSLQSLVNVTKADGALFIMVYAIYLRQGIYYLQDAFEYLGLEPTKKDVGLIRNLIKLLPSDHYALNYINKIQQTFGTKDLSFDAGVVDTFLNARDVAYDINGLKNLIESSGAFFQCWQDNNFYYRDLINFSKEPKLNETYENLDPWGKADFTQKFDPNSGKFSFILRKDKKFEHIWFKKDKIKNNYSVHRNILYSNLNPLDIKNNSGGTIGNKKVQIPLTVEERIIWNHLNDRIDNIIENINLEFKKNNINQISIDSLKDILHLFWRRGRIDFSYI